MYIEVWHQDQVVPSGLPAWHHQGKYTRDQVLKRSRHAYFPISLVSLEGLCSISSWKLLLRQSQVTSQMTDPDLSPSFLTHISKLQLEPPFWYPTNRSTLTCPTLALLSFLANELLIQDSQSQRIGIMTYPEN